MRRGHLLEVSNKARFWGWLAPAIMIALCVVIAMSEGISAVWSDETIPTILAFAAIQFIVFHLVAHFLRVFSQNEHSTDD